MPKVNGHRYNIVCNSVQQREEITDDTLFAIYLANDDKYYDFSCRYNRVCYWPMTLSALIKFLETVPSERKYRLHLRPRKTAKRRSKRNVDNTMPE